VRFAAWFRVRPSWSFVLASFALGACQGTPEKVSLGAWSASGPWCGAEGMPEAVNSAGTTIGVTVPHTDWTWPASLSSLEWDLAVESELKQDGYMWTHQFAFTGGAVGFLGLQARGGYKADPPDGSLEITNMIVFWVSSSPKRAELGDVAYPDARTYLQLDHGLQWWTIHAKYPFKTCSPYHLTVALESKDSSGDLWYGAWVRDIAGGTAQVFVGRILVPAAWGPLLPSSSMWSNRIGYTKLTSCKSAESASAVFGFPTANGSLQPTSQVNRFATPVACDSSRFTALPGAVRQEFWPEKQ